MFLLASRLTVAAAAACAALAAWFLAPGPDKKSDTSLAAAIERTTDAKSLRLKITRDGKASEALVRTPQQRLRLNQPDGTYRIVQGQRAWEIDEKANLAKSGTSKLFADKQAHLDLLGLMGVDADARKDLAKAEPVEKKKEKGVEYDVYRVNLVGAAGKLLLVGMVEAGTRQLSRLECLRPRDGQFVVIVTVEVVSVDEAIPEELFVVGDTLSEDGRIGKIADAQGMVGVRPVMSQRFTPVSPGLLIMPGDWLRTDTRGANAVRARLTGNVDVTLGPGALVELATPRKLIIHSGDVQVAASAAAPVEVIGPEKQPQTLKDVTVLRVDRATEKLVRLDKQPLWLKGFEGKAVAESIGKLEVQVEGRNLPLTVGYHKVSVDIRDQIARTVVEESFVNHTSSRLEGVFYFPLPQDASISGFGMWIGNELVEADVVEKQRAREIYEIIKHERRDPGLLEWSGGNIFTARVFPIEPHSEKRVKITYTQVLPLRGDQYRYSYGLKSELLQQHPLRELRLDVKVNSVMPLKSVTSPTHLCRIDQTKHSAHVEYAAQQYAPTRDFEVTVEVDRRQNDVVMIPHRRGEDGYFMVLVSPPGEPGYGTRSVPATIGPQRDVLPTGGPLDLLILADTSASIDKGSRARQAELVAALLGSLTPQDTFNLATADVQCDWLFEKAMPASEENIEAARKLLEGRVSLGWTDLERAFASAFNRAGKKTKIVYIGDAVPTTGKADPVATAKRLKRLYSGQSVEIEGLAPEKARVDVDRESTCSCYAVSLSSSFESGVMQAIASLGGGSLRQIAGEQTPQVVARELLGEFARPSLRDLKVEFRGLRTARVYPIELPSVPAGTQQIILGRYLPEGRGQQGEVIVSGTLDGKPVRLSHAVSLADAEQGNSFIPRLWARMYLDDLLAQGASPAIKDEIIAMSEEYHIMTPYTSLLVLETDADRERFKVQRRFLMRDGEKFFAQGRDNANFELTQKQMQRAGLWRLQLRRMVLAELARLGRDPGLGAARYAQTKSGANALWLSQTDGSKRGIGSGSFVDAMPVMLDFARPAKPAGGPMREIIYSRSRVGGLWGDDSDSLDFDRKELAGHRFSGDKEASAAEDLGDLESDLNGRGDFELAKGERNGELFKGMVADDSWFGDVLSMAEPLRAPPVTMLPGRVATVPTDGRSSLAYQLAEGSGKKSKVYAREEHGWYKAPVGGRWTERAARANGYAYTGYDPIASLFPHLSPAVKPAAEPKSTWPDAARELVRGLLRVEAVERLAGGIEVQSDQKSFDAAQGDVTYRHLGLSLAGRGGWLLKNDACGSGATIQWADERERGAINRGLQLGRVRDAVADDRRVFHGLALESFMLNPLDLSHAGWTPQVTPRDDGTTLLVVKHADNPKTEFHWLISNERKVVLSAENLHEGKRVSRTRYGDFVQVAGAWWPQTIERFDAEDQLIAKTESKYRELKPDDFKAEIAKQLAGREKVAFLRMPAPSVEQAKRNVAAGKATFDDQMALLSHFMASQQWTRALEHLAAAEELARSPGGSRPALAGMRFVRDAVLLAARKHEELKQRIMDEAKRLVETKDNPDDLQLAQHWLGQASGVLEANEQMRLLETLKPVFDRQKLAPRAPLGWQRRRVSLLQQTSQTEAALALLKQLIERYPRENSLQMEYINALANAGEYEKTIAHIDAVLAGKQKWTDAERNQLRDRKAQLLEDRNRYDDLVKFLAEWLKSDPDYQSAYSRYLSALVRTDQLDEANKLALQWMEAVRPRDKEKLTPAAKQRAHAAINYATGSGHRLYSDRIEQRWLKPLTELAIRLMDSESDADLVENIMNRWQFSNTEAARDVRKAATEAILKGIDSLSLPTMRRLVGWVNANNPALEPQQWKRIAEGLKARFEKEEKPEVKYGLGELAAQVISQRLTQEEWLGFLRLRLKDAPPQYKAQYLYALFNALLSQPWQQALEDEAWALVPKLSASDKADEQLFAAVAAVLQLTDAMVERRNQANVAQIKEPEKLTRTELRAKQQEALKAAREAYSARLAEELKHHEAPLRNWVLIERMYLEVLLGRELPKVAEECWELVGAKPKKLGEEPEPTELLAETLRQRALAMLMNLAARKQAPEGLAERALKYLDAGIEIAAKDDPWYKVLKYQLLVALDRPKDLEKALAEWIATDPSPNGWRLTAGYLAAEQGRLEEAIAQFEKVAAADELGPADYGALAAWYIAVNRRADHQRAEIAVYKVLPEWQMSNSLYTFLRPWTSSSDGHLPTELDKRVLLIFSALFEKASTPQSYLWQLQQFYRETRDFRLLEAMADAVIGHTAGKAYPFVQQMHGVLNEVRDEATADSILERLAEVRKRAKTTVDQRALDMLEVQVERRASELLNQPGPHLQKALAALQRAFKRDWTAGEHRLMADFLAGLGKISQKELADEQVRQLTELHRQAEKGSPDRLHIGWKLAETHNAYNRVSQAIDLLTDALGEFAAARDGTLPSEAQSPMNSLISFHESLRHFAQGERQLLDWAKRPASSSQKQWLFTRLIDLYVRAVENDGETSLGRGKPQYKAVETKLLGAMEARTTDSLYDQVNRMCHLYRTAWRKKIEGVPEDVHRFAFKQLPGFLRQATSNYGSMVSTVGQVLADTNSPLVALEFAIVQAETQPKWLRLANEDIWSQLSYLMSQWRQREAGKLGELEPRLLKIVLDELRRDLQSGRSRNRAMYHIHYSHYWKEKADDFARVADEVYAQHKDSATTVAYIAEYLFNGLARHDRAIEIMLAAWKQGILEQSQQWQLVNYLHNTARFGESIAVLLPMIEKWPSHIEYYAALMKAYYKTSQMQRLAETLRQADAYFHEKNRWNEAAMAGLGHACLEAHLFAESVKYYGEAIPLHQRTHANRGIGNGVLSGYYGFQARAYAGLNKTAEAVDAAVGAVVSWGPTHRNRGDALGALRSVIAQSPDLPGYIAELDKRVAETNVDQPIVRKAMGQVFIDRGKFDEAIRQLTLAVELQPNDAETHQSLVTAFDRKGDKAGAVAQLLKSVELSRRDIALYKQLGHRYESLKQDVEAERAFAAMVEMQAVESESHTALAEVRQNQRRWTEAVAEWQRVVELRALEPGGLLGLAGAQIESKQLVDAEATLRKLEDQKWPSRFSDVQHRTQQLRQKLDAAKRQEASKVK